MSSKPGVIEVVGDFPMDLVFDSLDNLENGNVGASLTDLFGYSKDFEDQLHHEINDDFKLTSLLYGSENDIDLLKNFVSVQESCETVQEFYSAAYKVPEEQAEMQISNDPIPPPVSVQTSGGNSHFNWSSELHAGFMGAIKHLGGFERATPGNIIYQMNVNGLTVDHVKAHIQECLQGTYFADESKGVSEIAGINVVAPPQEGPSNSRTPNKRPKRITRAEKDAIELKARCEAQIDRFRGAENDYMDSLLKRAGQLLGDFGLENDTGALPNLNQYYYPNVAYNQFA